MNDTIYSILVGRVDEKRALGGKKMEGRAMKATAAEGITARLSSLDNLYFPRAVQSIAASSDQRKSILLDLLRRDPAVFLGTFHNPAQILNSNSNFVMAVWEFMII